MSQTFMLPDLQACNDCSHFLFEIHRNVFGIIVVCKSQNNHGLEVYVLYHCLYCVLSYKRV